MFPNFHTSYLAEVHVHVYLFTFHCLKASMAESELTTAPSQLPASPPSPERHHHVVAKKPLLFHSHTQSPSKPCQFSLSTISCIRLARLHPTTTVLIHVPVIHCLVQHRSCIGLTLLYTAAGLFSSS